MTTHRHPRIPCLVPGCGCGSTSYPPGYEIICPKHYRHVPASLKALRRRAKRAGRDRLYHLLWRRMRRIAIQAALGIG